MSGPGPDRADREARLRPEFASLYPGVPAGEWHQAARLADMVWARRLERGDASFQLRDRVLSAQHFEFRQGTAQASEPRAGRRRGELREGE